MLQRLRHLVRRWPGLCLALALTACVSQGVAGALSWCLHGGDGSHVTSSVASCHVEATQAAGFGHAPDHCHASSEHTAHVAVASEAAGGAAFAMPAAPAPLLWSYAPPPDAAPVGALRDAARAGRSRGRTGLRPSLSGAIPGDSTRLLI